MALSVAEVRAALAEGDEGIRQGAIARLDLVETGAVALLVQAMADESWRVRREAVQCCGSMASNNAAAAARCRALLWQVSHSRDSRNETGSPRSSSGQRKRCSAAHTTQ